VRYYVFFISAIKFKHLFFLIAGNCNYQIRNYANRTTNGFITHNMLRTLKGGNVLFALKFFRKNLNDVNNYFANKIILLCPGILFSTYISAPLTIFKPKQTN
jgi:hypothetical protein